MDEITAPYAVAELHEPVPLRVRINSQVAAKTDLGRVRENNEDKFEFYIPTSDEVLARRGHIYLVCDGMGGHNAGQIASELATKTFIEVYLNHPATDPGTAGIAAAHAAHRFVTDVGRAVAQRRGMGTTLTALLLVQDRMVVVQVGDSRAYRLRNGVLEQITTDQTWVEDVIAKGVMDREAAEQHQFRHVILQAIGGDNDLSPDLYEDELQSGDTFLICSDGLTNHLSNPQIHEMMTEAGPSESCWQMVNAALADGGSDNCTAMVVKVELVNA
ncbi:MAG: serine/threonine-protein phosphatase [Chthonomonas sp.]|nr:serine/threonine-protein phosphatase [Chthonomonas sp.]